MYFPLPTNRVGFKRKDVQNTGPPWLCFFAMAFLDRYRRMIQIQTTKLKASMMADMYVRWNEPVWTRKKRGLAGGQRHTRQDWGKKKIKKIKKKKGKTHIRLTNQIKIDNRLHGDRQTIRPIARPATDIPPRPLADLIQRGSDNPRRKAHEPENNGKEARDARHGVGGAHAAEAVRDHDAGVEQEGQAGDGEQHDGGPEDGVRGPGAHAVDGGVARAQVFGERHGHDGGDDGGEREGGGALAHLEQADFALELL
jgi:hypothetical protein